MKFAVSLLLAAATVATAQTTVTKAPFGTLRDGKAADLYTLKDAQLTITITSYGAHVTSIVMKDKTDVVLGHPTLDEYLHDSTYMGSVVGRYGNRIGGGKFSLDGHDYTLVKSEPTDTLHGGRVGFDKHNWDGKEIPNGIELTLVSPDGDQGFPGTLTAKVRYTLMGDKLRMDYSASTDKPTVINLTNHSYFNLTGSGDVLGQTMMIKASKYTPVDASLIPTGEIAPVEGTPFDFSKPTLIGAHIHDTNDQLKLGAGFDHNYVFDAHTLATPVAIARDPKSGRTLTVYTTEPAVQFYSGNHLDGTQPAFDGGKVPANGGFCLETQHYPDSPNKPKFPSTTLLPGKPMMSTTIFQFTVTGIK